MNILYVIGCKNIHTVLLKLHNQFYMSILYEIVCKNVHTFMKKNIWTPCVFLIFFTFFERILYKSNCIIFIFSRCGTHTKIRSKLVVIVTAGSQKITLWGPPRTPLGILRVKMKDTTLMLYVCVCVWTFSERLIDTVSTVVTTQECMQGISVQGVWPFLPLVLEKQIVVCVH